MRILFIEVTIVLLLVGTLISGGGVGLILAELGAVCWLGNFRVRNARAKNNTNTA